MFKAISENMFGDVVGNKFGNSVGSIFVVLGTCVIIKGSYGAPGLNLRHSARIWVWPLQV